MIIKTKIRDTTFRKRRYLNTTSNKKRLLLFEPGSIDLEESRLRYNLEIQRYNTIIEEKNIVIRRNLRKIKYLKNKEIALNKKIKNDIRLKQHSALIISRFFERRFSYSIIDTAYKKYNSYQISNTFLKDKYDTDYFNYNNIDEKIAKTTKAILDHYGKSNEKSHIEDRKNNRLITSMGYPCFKKIVYTSIQKFKKLVDSNEKSVMKRIFLEITLEHLTENSIDLKILSSKVRTDKIDVSNMNDLLTNYEKIIGLFYDHNGSACNYKSLLKITDLKVNIFNYDPLVGSSYCKLPLKIENSNSIINIQNTDNKCFLY